MSRAMDARERRRRRELATFYPIAYRQLAAAELAELIRKAGAHLTCASSRRNDRSAGASESQSAARDGVTRRRGWTVAQTDRPSRTPKPVVEALEGAPAPPGGASLDWRAARKALRLAGHEVKQLDGIVYVDGQRSDDPALRA